MYTWDSLLIKDLKRLWHIHTVQKSNMQYAFGVQVYGQVLNLEFYSVFSEQFTNDEILLCKRLWIIFLWKWNPAHVVKQSFIRSVPPALLRNTKPNNLCYCSWYILTRHSKMWTNPIPLSLVLFFNFYDFITVIIITIIIQCIRGSVEVFNCLFTYSRSGHIYLYPLIYLF